MTALLRNAVRAALLGSAAVESCAVAALLASVPVPLGAAELPVPCVAGVCGSNVSGFVTAGAATAATTGNTLTITQTSQSATLNWSKFNVSKDGTVTFVQPDSSATALNRIYQNDPARIFGALNANGRVFLLNRNGVVFGETAKVNVGGLLASTLDLTPQALERGIAGAGSAGAPALTQYKEGGVELQSGAVVVKQGATIATSEGGQVLIFAPEIRNEGKISSPGGQTLLAAGTPVYLATSSDPGLRGLLVEVGAGGTVTNGLSNGANSADPERIIGQIIAERGNVTLAGLAVNQNGRVSASTSVRANGSIRLQARDGGSVNPSNGRLSASNGGQLTLGAGSLTSVGIVNNPSETDVDANEQPRSRVELQGKTVAVLGGASVVATGGIIKATARAVPGLNTASLLPASIAGNAADGSRIYVAQGAVLDVAGATVELPMERNVVRAELRGEELANSPVQRDGALRGQAVFVDSRLTGTRPDGSTWVGTPLANLSGQVSLVGRSAAERNLAGGSIALESQGDVIVAQGARLDVSGGSIRYLDGYINTSQLRGADGKLYDIGNADPNRVYTGVVSGYSIKHDRWGVTESFATYASPGRFEAGYVEGKDAGSVQILSPRAVVDGDVVGNVTIGRYQRRPAQLVPASALYRPYDQVPLAARLVLGTVPVAGADRVTGDLTVGGGLVLPTLSGSAGGRFDPLRDVLPDDVRTSLRQQLFGDSRVGRVELHSNGSIVITADTAVTLPAGGEFSATAGRVELAGRISSPSGTVTLNALRTDVIAPPDVRIDVRSTAVIDVAGQWVNEAVPPNRPGAPLPPLYTSGGKVTINARQGSLRLADGSLIDVSGGARGQANGAVTGGAAGSIALSATPDTVNPGSQVFESAARLLGYGITNGGSLSLSAPEVCIGVTPCGAFTVQPAALLNGGFANITLRSTEGGLTVQSGVDLDLRQSNRVLTAAARTAASGTRLADISTIQMLADTDRRPVNLNLITSVAPLPLGLYTNLDAAGLPALVVQAGAALRGDVGASIALRSNSSLIVAGQISAPAGSISLTLDNTLAIGEVLRNQGIWLDTGASLIAGGSVRLLPNDYGLRRGQVFNGGTVSITAQRGSVVLNPGSLIDVSGASAVLDIAQTPGSVAPTVAQTIASNGGRVVLTAADAMLVGGELRADPGAGSTTAIGGELVINLNANDRAGSGERYPLTFTERRIIVGTDLPPLALRPGSVLPDSLFGRATLDAKDVMSAGFDSLALNAETTVGLDDFSNEVVAPGTVEFSGNVGLQLGKQLVIDAAQVTGLGQVALAAPYLRLGHTDRSYQQIAPLSAPQTGTLSLQGALVELIGNSTIAGFGDVSISSSGDIRMRGVQQAGAQSVAGSLTTVGDLLLRSQQVYATTLSDFRVTAGQSADGTLRIESAPGARDTVLSAGSRLTLRAATIEQGGVVRAPFGTIDLQGNSVLLQPGSLTSTSAEGALIPFGAIQAGTDWVYGLQGQTVVVGDTTAVPEQSVLLNGDRVAVAAGAVVDVSGGGDMLAYEFIPGPTGKLDVLSDEVNPGLFAILPGLSLDYAPFDPQESSGSKLAVGDAIVLAAGVDGLPAGRYVLLPAAYALLPGAFVVSAVDGYQDMPTGSVVKQLDGTTIISGRRVTANTAFADARSGGFAVRTAAQVATLARYDTTLASKYMAARAAAGDPLPGRTPKDAGLLSIAAGRELTLAGALNAAAQGGRGAQVDISATRLLVGNAANVPAGTVLVDPDQLAALRAESLLLGGQRRTTADGVAIATNAEAVTIGAGAKLALPELLLAATDDVTVESGAQLVATGKADPAPADYLLNGDGALLRLAAGPQAVIRRSNETGSRGTLTLADGALLRADGGSLALDASLDTRSAASLVLPDGSLSLGASRINFGAVPSGASGLALDAASLSALGLKELALVSRSSIDFYGPVDLSLQQLDIDAVGMRQVGGQGDVTLTARDTIRLANRSGQASDPVGTTSGTLTLTAQDVLLEAGVQQVTGFALVDINATRALSVQGAGGVSADANLQVRTPLLDALQSSRGTLTAAGSLTLLAPVSLPGTAPVSAGELAGAWAFSGDSVLLATRVAAAAGRVEIDARSDVRIAAGGSIDVAGQARAFDGVVVSADAGEIRLRSATGDVLVDGGSKLNFAAAADGRAGLLQIAVPLGRVVLAGQVDGAAVSAERSGRASIDAGQLGSVDEINAVLNAGGVFRARTLRQRGAGDLLIAGVPMQAQRVQVTADGGRLLVSGRIDASGEQGGNVVLAARDQIVVSGSIDAHARSASGAAGSVALRSTNAGVSLAPGSSVDVTGGSGAAGGRLDMRVTRAAALTLADADPTNDAVAMAGEIVGARRVSLEGYAAYTDADALLDNGTITEASVVADRSNRLFAEAEDFMASEAAIAAGLGLSGDPRFAVLPGIELQSSGDIALGPPGPSNRPSAVDWDLSAWRFGSGAVPGVLTLRAGGNLTFNGSLSDGFVGVTGNANSAAFRLAATPSESWSYRLIAGADLASADLLAVDAATAGDVVIAGGNPSNNVGTVSTFRMIRTGTGSIDVAASGDFRLTNRASVLYTAGAASVIGTPIGTGSVGLGGRAYPVGGGDISIAVLGDIIGGDSEGPTNTFVNQLVTDWLWRSGKDPAFAPTGFATAWTVNFARFEQNVAALGGGSLRISAGGDILNFSASVPSVGLPSATTAANSRLTVASGGDIMVEAGGDILGGGYFVGRGHGSLQAGGNIGSAFNPLAGGALYPTLALMEGSWQLTARGDAGIETVVNPTLLPQGRSQGTAPANQSTFSTYAPDSRIEIKSIGGNVRLSNNTTRLTDWLSGSMPLSADAQQIALRVYAPSLSAVALGGDLTLDGQVALFPAFGSSLQLFAERDVTRLNAEEAAILLQSDADPRLLPNVSAPTNTGAAILEALGSPTSISPSLHAAIPVHRGDASVSRIVARTGDITFKTPEGSLVGNQSLLSFSTPVRAVAGGDIIDLPLLVQHDDVNDLTSIIAGGDIRYSVARTVNGSIQANNLGMDLSGPGALQLVAGGDVDLQTSRGITTLGNLTNPALPVKGADISVVAGLNGRDAAYPAMIRRYLDSGPTQPVDMVAYVESVTGETGLTPAAAQTRYEQLLQYRLDMVAFVEQRSALKNLTEAEALAIFESYAVDLQRIFLDRVLLAELQYSGRDAAVTGSGNFTRAFTALETLYPGSNPDLNKQEVNPYSGNIALYFSRIYALAGGDISLFAPGGSVNAGLASPPASFGLVKTASDLGIVIRGPGSVSSVSYGDFQVNESRVFATDGGNILVWSTDGDIDAGRGAKTAISAPAPTITFDDNGAPIINFPTTLTGSGIQTLATTPGVKPGNVDLFAPRGVVNAGDAGIVAGNLTIAATAVIGADNIQFGGVAVGVPVDAGGLGASLSGATSAAGGASSAAATAVDTGEKGSESKDSLAGEQALSWLDVFVVGLGEETCSPKDIECLKRQPKKP